MEYSIFSFPLEQIGWGLRQLSLSGAAGNVFAIIIYLLIGALPCGIFSYLKRKGKCRRIDGMLFGLSVLLLIVMYYMINPGLLAVSMLGIGTKMLGAAFYSVLTGYLVLRMVTETKERDLQMLQKGLRMVLCVVMLLFAWSVLAEFFMNLPSVLAAVTEANTGAADGGFYGAPDLTMTYLVLVLQSVVDALPNGLSVVVVFLCIRALDELIRNSYSEKAIVLVRRIAGFCKKALVTVVAAEMVFNLMQMALGSQLYQMHIRVNIPVFSILFLLVIHVLARYIEENYRLKADNELFI